LEPKLGALLALKDPALKTLGVEIMIAHRLKAAPDLIGAIVADAGAVAELRAQALRLMAGGTKDGVAEQAALATALAPGSPAPLHRAALELLLPGQPERLVQAAQEVLAGRAVAEKQHALALLAKAAHPAADAVLATWADALVAGTVADTLKLDVLEAAQTRGAANTLLATKVKAYAATPEAAKQGQLLAGGDWLAGREIVQSHLNANCLACHGVDAKAGSEVGPNLSAIGNERDAAYLLESLLVPGASIAPGFGLVSVTLKSGEAVGGTLAQETPTTVAVRLFDGSTKTIARAEIASQTPAISIMPPMLGILQPREIRDVVAYLGSLKPKPRGKNAPKAEGGE